MEDQPTPEVPVLELEVCDWPAEGVCHDRVTSLVDGGVVARGGRGEMQRDVDLPK
jgi:hypothetical protein